MNTDIVQLWTDAAYLDKLKAAASVVDVTSEIDQICRASGMTHFVVVRYASVLEPRRLQLLHNAPDAARFDDVGELERWPVVDEQFQQPGPRVFGIEGYRADARPGPPGFTYGAGAGLKEGAGIRCFAAFGRDEPVPSEEAAFVVLTNVMMAANAAAVALARILKNECPLSGRELDCLRCAMAGLTAKEAARRLGVGIRSVDEYLERARKRLDARNTTAAGRIAIESGWVTFEEVERLAS